jgi:hypothetical protein
VSLSSDEAMSPGTIYVLNDVSLPHSSVPDQEGLEARPLLLSRTAGWSGDERTDSVKDLLLNASKESGSGDPRWDVLPSCTRISKGPTSRSSDSTKGGVPVLEKDVEAIQIIRALGHLSFR